MKPLNIITACTLTFFISIIMFAQEPDPNSFFPSSVGNIWEYDTPSGLLRNEIVKDSISEDSSKFIFYNFEFPTYKIDSSYDTFWFPTGLNWLKYKLDADSGYTWMVAYEDSSGGRNGIKALVRNKYLSIVFWKTNCINGNRILRIELG